MDEQQIEMGGGGMIVEQVQFGPGFALKVDAKQDAVVSRAGALVVAAGRNVEMTRSGSLLMASGRDTTFANGFSQVNVVGHDLVFKNSAAGGMKIGGNAEITNSAVLGSVSKQASAQHSAIGVILASKVELGEGNRVVLNTPQAAVLGAALGAVFALVSWLLRRK